jgi:hypothetical protein
VAVVSIAATSSETTVAKIVIHQTSKGKMNGDDPLLMTGVYSGSNGRESKRSSANAWRDPKHRERFAYFKLAAERSLDKMRTSSRLARMPIRSREPQHCPGRLSDEVIAHIVAARQRWKWGPRKLRVKLSAAHPDIPWPAEITIGAVLKRAGLTHSRKLRVRRL